MKILVIAPHSDDEVLGCGGSIALHTARGDKAVVAILSESVSAQYPSQASMFKIRQNACIKACKVLGVNDVKFFDLPDARMNECIFNVIGTINEAMRLDNFDMIYIPDISEMNTDHRATFEASLIATRPNRCNIRTIMFYETSVLKHSPFIPNHYVSIEDTIDLKMDAFRAYQTEVRDFPDPYSMLAIKVLAWYRGIESSNVFAEGFISKNRGG